MELEPRASEGEEFVVLEFPAGYDKKELEEDRASLMLVGLLRAHDGLAKRFCELYSLPTNDADGDLVLFSAVQASTSFTVDFQLPLRRPDLPALRPDLSVAGRDSDMEPMFHLLVEIKVGAKLHKTKNERQLQPAAYAKLWDESAGEQADVRRVGVLYAQVDEVKHKSWIDEVAGFGLEVVKAALPAVRWLDLRVLLQDALSGSDPLSTADLTMATELMESIHSYGRPSLQMPNTEDGSITLEGIKSLLRFVGSKPDLQTVAKFIETRRERMAQGTATHDPDGLRLLEELDELRKVPPAQIVEMGERVLVKAKKAAR